MRSEDIIINYTNEECDEISTVSLFHSTIHCSVSFLVSQFYYDYSIEDETQQQQKIDDPNCMPHIILLLLVFCWGGIVDSPLPPYREQFGHFALPFVPPSHWYYQPNSEGDRNGMRW